MLRRVSRPSAAMIVACIALLVALSGTSIAAVSQLVPRNSVGTAQLQRNAVKPSKIAPNAVRTAHVLNGSLLAADFKAGQIPSGPKGDKGDKGEKGDKGDKGNPGATNVVVRWSQVFGPAAGAYVRTAMCAAGEVAVGGGVGTTGLPSIFVTVRDSKPSPLTEGGTPRGWTGAVQSSNVNAGTMAVYVVCARP